MASEGVGAAVSRSKALRDAVKERSIDAGISALAMAAGAGAAGAPIAPAALGGAAAGAGLRLLYESLFKIPNQRQSVALYLAQREQT
jgi:hypothetical protein